MGEAGTLGSRGCFVTGTDTGVGKTIVVGAIAAALAARGERVAAFKPVVTGLAAPAPDVPPDHELLAAITGQAPAVVAAARFDPPVSPHFAAELAGTRLDPAALLEAARVAARDADALIVEGVGGLLVPLADDCLVRDFACALGLPLIIVARPGVGTISHTLLTLEAARAVGLEVSAVVLTPWPDRRSARGLPIERSNRETIERLGAVEVAVLPRLRRIDRAVLARAGAQLEPERWIASDRVAV